MFLINVAFIFKLGGMSTKDMANKQQTSTTGAPNNTCTENQMLETRGAFNKVSAHSSARTAECFVVEWQWMPDQCFIFIIYYYLLISIDYSEHK